MARLEDHAEVELKLTVVGDDPDGVLDALASVETLGDEPLGPVRRHALRDRYWDTADFALRRAGLTLRVREQDGAELFTVKGGTSSKGGVFRRYELELPATRESWGTVLEALASHGVPLDGDADPGRGGAPADWVRATGLIVTQDRTTDRRTRAVLRDDRPVAELALDCTTFRLRGLDIRYREVEVETLAEDAPDLGLLGERIVALFPGRLEPSTMGKYSRGLALEKQLRASGLV
jgi:triphosphatase